MAEKTKICDTVDCGNVVSPGSSFDVCVVCRGAHLRWRRKRPAQVLEYRRKLNKYGDRIDAIIGDKVVVLRRRRSA